MNEMSPGRTDKFRAYRARKRAQGLREVRIWAADVRLPGFQERLEAEMRSINAASDSKAVIRWSEQCAAEIWGSDD